MFQLFLYFIIIQKIFSHDLLSLDNKRELASICSNGLSNGNYIFRSSSKQSWSFCGVSGTGYHEFRFTISGCVCYPGTYGGVCVNNATSFPSSSPTLKPTYSPSVVPTFKPSSPPTTVPTFVPSVVPTLSPTYVPSVVPTLKPSSPPTTAPTFVPSVVPTFSPSSPPTTSPTFKPSSLPTFSPSYVPSVSPTFKPSVVPTTSPTFVPSVSPTFVPSVSPTTSPTFKPSVVPTSSPTFVPSVSPTFSPTRVPSVSPTFSPSVNPTTSPSVVPSVSPSFSPSSPPTVSPTFKPSSNPTFSPSVVPSVSPTFSPSSPPTVSPTFKPSVVPTLSPSVVPSVVPTFKPSSPPTVNPTFKPSVEPTLSPSYSPSVVPTFKPSSPPTIVPTFVPSVVPTLSPSFVPSVVPTLKPSSPPTVNPTFVPSVVPTFKPTFSPSVNPTFTPSSPPTLRPTPNPTANPTRNPTFTISNELYCDKDYIPSSSETCLLVTLTDQFGDGWTNGDGKSENAEFEYSIGYTGGDFSSVISHKLNCSCEKVMGCIHPVGLNRNQIFSFSVNSLVESTPEYYWEIMWKVQIVEKGVNKGYFYGGYSTELILNYDYDTGVYSYDSSSSNVWDLSSCTAPSPINLVSDLAVDGYSITDTSKKTLFSSEDPFCSFTRAPTFAPSSIPTISPTPGTGGRTPTPRPTIASTVIQMSATTDLTGLSASQVDEGVQKAFMSITANALGVDSEDINITSITDVSVRRLGSNGRYLSTPQVRIGFTIVIVLEQSSYTSGSEAVSGLQTLLTQSFSSSTTASDLVSLAIQLGSTTVTSSTVLVISSPTIDSDFVIIIVRTDSPTPSPKNDDEEDDTTAIIIGVVVGGVAFLGIVGALIYFMFMKNGNKVNPA